MGHITDAVAAAKKPQDALLAIAAALDEIREGQVALAVRLDELLTKPDDGWGAWDEPVETSDESEVALKVVVNDESADGTQTHTEFPETDDPAVREQREAWWSTYMSDSGLGDAVRDAYIKCGPTYLYAHSRSLVIQLPHGSKQQLIRDVIAEGRMVEAHDMARDILMDRGGGAEVPEAWAAA